MSVDIHQMQRHVRNMEAVVMDKDAQLADLRTRLAAANAKLAGVVAALGEILRLSIETPGSDRVIVGRCGEIAEKALSAAGVTPNAKEAERED